MALIVADRVKQESTTTGTGTISFAGGVDGFQNFSDVCSTNDTMYYCIQDKVGTNFEIGHGTFNGSGQLERTNVLQSSNSDNAVNFGSGTKEVFVTYPADKAVFQNYNGSITIPSTIDGRDLQTDGTKLDGIEASATADQTASEIRTLVESATDSNVFTDADHTKLNGVEASATADQTGAEIKSAYEGESDTNAFTDALQTKLNGIETSATADQTDAEIRTAVEAATDSNVFTDADHTKLNGIEASADVTDTANVTSAGALMDSEVTNLAEVKSFAGSDYATAAQGTLATNALPKAGGTMTGDLILGDDVKVEIGSASGGDLEIFHESSSGHSKMKDNSGVFKILGDSVRIRSADDSKASVNFNPAGEVEIHHNNSLKLNTTSSGVTVTGTLTATAFSGDGSSLTGIASDVVNDTTPQLGGDLAVNGHSINFNDNNRLRFGNGDDFEIFHNGSQTIMDESGTGSLEIRTNSFGVATAGGLASMIAAAEGGAVQLYYNGSHMASTVANGFRVEADKRLEIGNGTNWSGEQAGKIENHSDSMYHQYTNNFITRNPSGTNTLTIDSSGNGTFNANVTAYSDIRLKEDVKTIDNALDKVSKLRGVEYTRKETKAREIGVIAQEVKEIIPELVRVENTKSDINPEGLEDLHTMKYGNTVGLLIEAIKELKNEIEKLKKQ